LQPLLELHRKLRTVILAACAEQSTEALSTIAEDGEGDTLFAVDKICEKVLLEELDHIAHEHGGIVLIAEGIEGGKVSFPRGLAEARCRYRVIIDPIDGTREIMVQKRPAWILTGVAPNKGDETALTDIELAVQTEIPLTKQYLSDELWAVRGLGATGERVNLFNAERKPLQMRPSRASSIEQGFAMISRFFPGARDELAAIDDELAFRLLGPCPAGKAHCFEDQYLSTGGQLYELMLGHDRFVADIRPLLRSLLKSRGFPLGLCCHPYDICTSLIAAELGVVIRNPEGNPLDCRLNVTEEVAWVGYANTQLARSIEPVLRLLLMQRGLLETNTVCPT
jgi:fructose-1,6-bisphosphatase/inositol monophosphatase family enzyme